MPELFEDTNLAILNAPVQYIHVVFPTYLYAGVRCLFNCS